VKSGVAAHPWNAVPLLRYPLEFAVNVRLYPAVAPLAVGSVGRAERVRLYPAETLSAVSRLPPLHEDLTVPCQTDLAQWSPE